MRLIAAVFCLAPLLTPAATLAQDGPEILEIRDAWQACTAHLEATANDWVGWRRNFDGGYADHFEFHEGGDADVSVLVQTWLIDAIAIQTDTACYRDDGTLAFIFSQMTSPNMAVGFDSPAITREGRIYFAPDGEVVRILGRIVANGEEVATLDDDRYMLARGCELTQPHLTVVDVWAHIESELGTIEGERPAFTPNFFAWCDDPMLYK